MDVFKLMNLARPVQGIVRPPLPREPAREHARPAPLKLKADRDGRHDVPAPADADHGDMLGLHITKDSGYSLASFHWPSVKHLTTVENVFTRLLGTSIAFL
jgi:hypothetical protein